MAQTTKRLSYDEAADQLMRAGAALSTLTDEANPARVVKAARMIDAVVGQSMESLAGAKDRGDQGLAVARVTGAVRVASAALPDLAAMPEAKALRFSISELQSAFDAFFPGEAR